MEEKKRLSDEEFAHEILALRDAAAHWIGDWQAVEHMVKIGDDRKALLSLAQKQHEALKKLSFAAQITGGTAGRDENLVEAIDFATPIIAAFPTELNQQHNHPMPDFTPEFTREQQRLLHTMDSPSFNEIAEQLYPAALEEIAKMQGSLKSIYKSLRLAGTNLGYDLERAYPALFPVTLIGEKPV